MIDNITIKVVCFEMAHYFANKTNTAEYNGISFNPKIENSKVVKWTGKLQNLYLTFQKDELTISNSIHKFYHGNNYCDFHFEELIQAFINLSEILQIDLSEAKIKKIEYGCNLTDPGAIQLLPKLRRYKSRFFVAMYSKTVVYGKKVSFTNYAIKFYNKQLEVKLHDKSVIEKATLRYEKEAKIRYLRQKSFPIETVADLLKLSNLKLLVADLLETSREIDKKQFIDLDSLSIEELKKYSLLENGEAHKVALKNHRISVNRYKKELKPKCNANFYDDFEYQCLFQLKSIPEFQSKSIPFKFNKKGLFLPGGTPGKE